jgi:hypothetical protein
MTQSKHAAPEVESGSGADPQTKGNTDLDITDHALREAAGDDGLLHMLVNLPTEGGRYLKCYQVTISLNVEPVGTDSKAGDA